VIQQASSLDSLSDLRQLSNNTTEFPPKTVGMTVIIDFLEKKNYIEMEQTVD
jgi:hypothetical protein